MTMFMGKPMSYWIELNTQAELKGVDGYIQENALLRAKVSFYESRIEQMHAHRKAVSLL